jgi:copper chaperone
MTTFRVEDMTCGRCARAITQAIASVDAEAKVTVDISGHLVHIDGSRLDTIALASAIEGAGYHPLQLGKVPATQGEAKAGGCCCR